MISETAEKVQFLSREDLLSPMPRRYATVGPLPVRGGYVRLQSLFENEASAYEAERFSKGDLVQARLLDMNCRFIVRCVVNEANDRILGPQDVPAMMAKWDRADIAYLYTEASNHVAAKKVPIDDLEKNSDGTPAGS